jgi:hypothetical protein
MRYLVLGSILLFTILYLSRDMRDLPFTGLLPALSSWKPESVNSLPRHATYQPRPGVEGTKEAMAEKKGLEEWIQSRLTQKGLKEMTESGHWQYQQASTL